MESRTEIKGQREYWIYIFKVAYISSIMVNCEVCSGKFWLAKAFVCFICLVHLLCKCLVS